MCWVLQVLSQFKQLFCLLCFKKPQNKHFFKKLMENTIFSTTADEIESCTLLNTKLINYSLYYKV